MTDTLVQDSARRLFADLVPPSVVNAAEAGTWPVELWDAVAEAGFPDALAAGAEAPGDLSGMGDAAAILREAGRYAAPLPLAESMLARWLLAGAGIAAPEGPLTIAPVERKEAFTLRRDGRLSGKATGVPWAAQSAGIVTTSAPARAWPAIPATTSPSMPWSRRSRRRQASTPRWSIAWAR